jgi:formamidopyrimidine-DNA glycosylase
MDAMPELPEVETVRLMLEPQVRGRSIRGTWTFGTPKFEQAIDATGVVGGIQRRGKYLLFDLAPGTPVRTDIDRPNENSGAGITGVHTRELIVHLGMTGRLSVSAAGVQDGYPAARGPHVRAVWQLSDGAQLVYTDARRFGRIAVVDAGDYSGLAGLAHLGPEPWDERFTPASLRVAATSSQRALKTLLLGQRVVAGLGNIYADEALWLAGLSPRRRGRLSLEAANRLHESIRVVLAAGIDHGGTTLRDYRNPSGQKGNHQQHLNCYGRGGLPCLRCGRTLNRYELDGRSTTACPGCQR